MKQPTKLSLSDIDAALIGAGFTNVVYGNGLFYAPVQWTEDEVREVLPGAPFFWQGKSKQSMPRARAMAALVKFIEKHETQ